MVTILSAQFATQDGFEEESFNITGATRLTVSMDDSGIVRVHVEGPSEKAS